MFFSDDPRWLGPIVRLQIQRAPLKTGEKPQRHYDPAPLLAVDGLTLTPEGAQAPQPDGSVLLDVHHARHPQSRLKGVNALSINFTGHYEAMQTRFGERASLGCAGENLLVAVERRVTLEELAGGLMVVTADGARIRLAHTFVAAPCKPFTGYLLQRQVDSDTLKRSLQFLDDGTRGFYVSLVGTAPAQVHVGDQVFSLPE